MLDQIEQVSVVIVAEELRLEALPKHFGKAFLEYERLVYSYMDYLCPEYTGGYWEFYELGNGGFFMQLKGGERYTLNSPNGSCYEVSVQSASIVVCLFAQCHLMQKYPTDALIEKYHQLRDFAGQLDEANEIYQLID